MFAWKIISPAASVLVISLVLVIPGFLRIENNVSAAPPSMEQKVLNELNSARKRPLTYVWNLWDYRKSFNGNNIKLPDGTTIVTKEGLVPVNEAIREMNESKPVPAFELSNALSKAAKAHVDDLVKTNTSGHTGSDGSALDKRLEKYGRSSGAIAENIAYSAKTQKDVVIKMIVDDGNANRNHRKNVFNSKFKKVGIAAGDHPTYGPICIIIFAESFTENRGGLQAY